MDVIDRDQAIYMLRINRPSMDKKNKSATLQFYRDLNAIKATPSAEKTGRWIWVDDNYFCSECSNRVYGNTLEIISGQWRYCPVCGARMGE